MVDERFDVVHGARLWWWRGKRMVRIAWSAGHIVDALLDNPEALAHLLDVYGRTIVTVARAANRYIEFELVVAGIGLFPAKIPLESARAQVWTCHTPFNCFVCSAASNAFRAGLKQAVVHDGAFVLIEPGWQVLQKVTEQAIPSVWQILGHPSNPEPVRVHARAANRFNDTERSLAVVEHIEHRRHLAKILCERAVPNQMADNAEELRHHHSNHLPARRHCDAGQLFYRRQVREIVHHAAQIVHAIGVRNIGMPRLALAHLFGAAVMKAYLRYGIDNLFAIQLENYAQNTMRAGVLRTHIQENKVRSLVFSRHAPLFRAEPQCFLFDVLLFVRQDKRAHLRSTCRMFLAQRMPRPRPRHENARQMRVLVEDDTKHVPHLTLVPISRGKDVSDRGQRGSILVERYL